MRTISLREYETTEAVRLSRVECDELRTAVSTLGISPTSRKKGHYDLRPESIIGTVQLESLAVEIRPKIPIDRVLFLISYAVDPKAWSSDNFGFIAAPSLFEALVPGFAHQLTRAIGRGLLRGYITVEEALSTIRGRVRIQEQVSRRFGRMPPVEVRYDDFTEDILENRLLRAAIHRLRLLRIRAPANRQRLRPFELILNEVTSVEYPRTQIPQVHFNRLNQHYRPAIELARIILRSTSPELSHGSVRSSSFLLDMNDVFENFVVVALRESLGLNERSFPQGAADRPLFLDENRRLRLRPDLSWWEGSECVFVGDVKYKKLIPPGLQHPDLYQLLAYQTALDLDAGLLIYAEGEDQAGKHAVAGNSKTLHVAALDLSGTPTEILDRVRIVADTVQRLRKRRELRRAAA